MLRNRLQGRASQTLVGLGRLLQQLCNEDGLVTQNQLHQGLRTYHIGLTPEVSVLLYMVRRTPTIVILFIACIISKSKYKKQ